MKKALIFVFIFIACYGDVEAQKTKNEKAREEKEKLKKKQEEKLRPDVLVIGNGNAAVAAAIQSAVSGVSTTILLQAGGFDITATGNDLGSGIQATFLKKYQHGINAAEQGNAFDKQKANTILTATTDSISNLTVIKNVMWVKAERSGNSWSFKLSDGNSIKPKILINPADEKLNEALKITFAAKTDWSKLDYSNTIYRTSVAAGKWINGNNGNIFSMYQFFIPNQENLVWISDPESFELGQAAGATAAYAAFFDTKTSLSNLKKIQGELVHYKLNLMPFFDVATTDSLWKAAQMVGITGILKAEQDGKTVRFSPDKLITTEEIKQPIKDFYYKAQIWFDDYKNPKMTIGSTLDMIAYVGNKSLDQLKKEIDKNWKKSYQFKTEFDLNRQINRREFAVLLQAYMPPFNVNVDEKGRVVR